MLFRPLVYLQVSQGAVRSSLVGAGESFLVASQGLSHPRTLMGDFVAVQEAIRESLQKAGVGGWFRRSPVVLVHLLPEPEGGYTNVELRAFREAALGAGAAQAWLLTNHPVLSSQDRESITKHFGRSIL